MELDGEDDDVHLVFTTASLLALSFPDLKDGLAARSGQHEQPERCRIFSMLQPVADIVVGMGW